MSIFLQEIVGAAGCDVRTNLRIEEFHPAIKRTSFNRSKGYRDFMTSDSSSLHIVAVNGLILQQFLGYKDVSELFVRCRRNIVVRLFVTIFTLVDVVCERFIPKHNLGLPSTQGPKRKVLTMSVRTL